jgi:hypothetical protein
MKRAFYYPILTVMIKSTVSNCLHGMLPLSALQDLIFIPKEEASYSNLCLPLTASSEPVEQWYLTL